MQVLPALCNAQRTDHCEHVAGRRAALQACHTHSHSRTPIVSFYCVDAARVRRPPASCWTASASPSQPLVSPRTARWRRHGAARGAAWCTGSGRTAWPTASARPPPASSSRWAGRAAGMPLPGGHAAPCAAHAPPRPPAMRTGSGPAAPVACRASVAPDGRAAGQPAPPEHLQAPACTGGARCAPLARPALVCTARHHAHACLLGSRAVPSRKRWAWKRLRPSWRPTCGSRSWARRPECTRAWRRCATWALLQRVVRVC